MVSLRVYQPSATGMSEEIKDTDCGWSGQVFVVMFSTDGGSCERRKETQVIPAKCDDSSTRTTAISYIFLPVVKWSTRTCTHSFIHLHLKEKKCYPLWEEEQMQKNERPLQHHFHNRILLFWSDLFLKRKKMQRTWNTHKSTFSSKVVYRFMNHMWWMRFMN